MLELLFLMLFDIRKTTEIEDPEGSYLQIVFFIRDGVYHSPQRTNKVFLK
jgi:hypothetical protein